jgi:hypothetical protein
MFIDRKEPLLFEIGIRFALDVKKSCYERDNNISLNHLIDE